MEAVKFEIQSRTILMHAWASINHKLSYKKDADIPQDFKRSLYRLSALIEIADQQFDILRNEQDEYIDSLLEKSPSGKVLFNTKASLNIDSLKTLLSVIFPDRYCSDSGISKLIEEMREVGVELFHIHEGYKKLETYLLEIEKESLDVSDRPVGLQTNKWSQEGLIRTILDITFMPYWNTRVNYVPNSVKEITNKWREIVAKD